MSILSPEYEIVPDVEGLVGATGPEAVHRDERARNVQAIDVRDRVDLEDMIRGVGIERIDVFPLLFLVRRRVLGPDPEHARKLERPAGGLRGVHHVHCYFLFSGVRDLADHRKRNLRRAAGEVQIAVDRCGERRAHRLVDLEVRHNLHTISIALHERLQKLDLDVFWFELGVDVHVHARRLTT